MSHPLRNYFHLLVVWFHRPTLMIMEKPGRANCHFDGWSERSLQAAWGRQSYPFISLGGVLGWSLHRNFGSSAHSATHQLQGNSKQVSSLGLSFLIHKIRNLDYVFNKILSLTWGFSNLFFQKWAKSNIFFPHLFNYRSQTSNRRQDNNYL